MDEPSQKPVKEAALAATSRALLCMLSYEEEISGYDLKKWIDWSVDLYYWSPSYSQIYTELKKLEGLGLVTSRVERDEGTRSRRLYKITRAGMDAAVEWVNDAPGDDAAEGEAASRREPKGRRVSLQRRAWQAMCPDR